MGVEFACELSAHAAIGGVVELSSASCRPRLGREVRNSASSCLLLVVAARPREPWEVVIGIGARPREL